MGPQLWQAGDVKVGGFNFIPCNNNSKKKKENKEKEKSVKNGQ